MRLSIASQFPTREQLPAGLVARHRADDTPCSMRPMTEALNREFAGRAHGSARAVITSPRLCGVAARRSVAAGGRRDDAAGFRRPARR